MALCERRVRRRRCPGVRSKHENIHINNTFDYAFGMYDKAGYW